MPVGSIRFLVTVLAIAWGLAALPLARAAKPPSWLNENGVAAADAIRGDAGAAVILDEATFDYDERGVVKAEGRWAVKIYDTKERDYAIASVGFEFGHSQVTHFRAWLIDPNGTVYRYEKKDSWDVADGGSDLHSTQMRKVYDASDSVRPGSVFAYEYKLKRNTVFSQLLWRVQQRIPVVRSQIRVDPPSGWTAEATFLNGVVASESREEDAFVWTSENVATVSRESGGPPNDALYGALGIDLLPSGSTDRSVLMAYRSWGEIAAHDSEVNDRQIAPNAAIEAKVKELCESAEGEWERLLAIANYAQSINYVSISTNLSLGGGYEPFTAAEVFERHYGDCKDKTALMRSMLQCIGKASYAVSADAGRDAFVDPSWPSLHQFNHCIVAIPVSDEIDAPAVVEDVELGRLLIFDPTSQVSPLGSLPIGMYGSYVLVGSDRTESLLRLPELEPQLNGVERRFELTLSESGDVSGRLVESAMGQRAARERARFGYRNDSEYKQMIVNWLTDRGRRVEVQSYSFSDDFEANQTELEAEFTAMAFARSMRGKYLIFRPFLVDRTNVPDERPTERRQPFSLFGSSSEETVTYELPEGFELEDAPKPLSLETEFARYESRIEVSDGRLLCSRAMTCLSREIPLEQYESLFTFLETASKAEETPVMLARKSGE